MSEKRKPKKVTTVEGAAGEPTPYTSPPEAEKPEAAVEARGQVLEAFRPPLRWPAEELPEPVKPLEPLEPLGADYAEAVGDALRPERIMPPMFPEFSLGEAPRLVRRAVAEPLRFQCPYGLGGQCCGCRYMPCNELTLAVLSHVSRDYGPGGRCSAD